MDSRRSRPETACSLGGFRATSALMVSGTRLRERSVFGYEVTTPSETRRWTVIAFPAQSPMGPARNQRGAEALAALHDATRARARDAGTPPSSSRSFGCRF